MMRALLIAALSAAPAGCERASADRMDRAPVLARVNGAEISLAAVAPAATGRAGLREQLDKVIDRELLVQRALALQLDRDPGVVAAIDAARRQILAQAYMDKLGAGRVSAEEAHAFYAENPALFAERRVYRLRELVVSAPAELTDMLRAEAARAASLDDLAAWLRSRDARFSVVALTQPAEELPLAYLPRLARMKDGEIALFARPAWSGAAEGVSVIQLEHAEPAPLDEPQARPLIERFLAARKRLEVASAEVKRLRESARIEYTTEVKP